MADQQSIPTFWLHIAEIVIGVVIIGAITFQIVRPTNSQKSTYQAGSTQIEYWKDSTVRPGFGGCVTIQTVKTPEVK